MPHIDDRFVHDADTHTMETKDWLEPFCEDRYKKQVASIFNRGFEKQGEKYLETLSLHDKPEFRAKDEEEFMARKNLLAIGSFRKEDRSKAIDLLGVQSQLVFPTSANVHLESLEHSDNTELLYAMARASNRAQIDFCSVDRRLLPVCNVPLADMKEAKQIAKEAIDMGARALLIPWACPKNHATSHIGLDPLWSAAQEAALPIIFHVGASDLVLPKAHANNGMSPIPDFHGGEENFRSISYMAIPSGPQQALSMLILDGVLERFPNLKVGIIELGAIWVPSYIRQLEAAMEAFGRHEERLQKLSLKPSEYVTRQVRVTPYPTEPTGWIIEQSGPEICMFSSDYPHVEGGRNPYGRFQNTTQNLNEETLNAFYRTNFEDLMSAAAHA